MKAPYATFAVGDKPYVVHDWDLRQRTLEYLSSLQANYFEQISDSIRAEPITASSALTLRLTYFHAVETFFALLFATLQAPWAIVAWLQHYVTSTLRRLVGVITACDRQFRYLKVDFENHGWPSVSDLINQFRTKDPELAAAVRAGFAQLWLDLSAEVVSDLHQSEYNQIKHGFRSTQGSLSISMRMKTEDDSGKVIQEKVLPGAKWGAVFSSVTPITGANSNQFALTRHVVNWDVNQMIARLSLLSYSINNVRSFARMLNGVPGHECEFLSPDDTDLFTTAHTPGIGLATGSIDRPVNFGDIVQLAEDKLLDHYSEKIRFVPNTGD